MISASHNPYRRQRHQVLRAGGRKLDDDVEDALEASSTRLVQGHHEPDRRPTGDAVGAVDRRAEHAARATRESVDARRSRAGDSTGCASSSTAPTARRRPSRRRCCAGSGPTSRCIHAEPDGTNINEGCGSTHPGDLQRAVVDAGADVGLAFDGDADRVLAVDARRRSWSTATRSSPSARSTCTSGACSRDDTVVVTVMTNLGLPPGHGRARHPRRRDRRSATATCSRRSAAGGYSLGGEQSGHVIFPDLATTGDGLLTGVQLLDVIGTSGRPLAELASVMTRLPQVLRNVRVARRGAGRRRPRSRPTSPRAEAELGEHGRVLVRPSGTEPLVRVMVEAPTAEQADAVADRLVADAVQPAG